MWAFLSAVWLSPSARSADRVINTVGNMSAEHAAAGVGVGKSQPNCSLIFENTRGRSSASAHFTQVSPSVKSSSALNR